MADTQSSASIQAANAAPAAKPAPVLATPVVEAESFFTKHEKAFVIGAIVAVAAVVIAVLFS